MQYEQQKLYEESKTLFEAREIYPKESLVYLKSIKEFGTVQELTESIDGVFVKIVGKGHFSIDDIRHATEEEMEQLKK